MAVLSASAVSQMASDVYIVKSDNLDPKDNPDLKRVLKANRQYFDLGMENKIEGKSGGLIINKTSGFGIVSQGKGVYSRDAFIILRGTASGYDVLTDLNAGFSSSVGGNTVHLGFNNTFKTIRPQLERFFDQQKSPITAVHCIGHSLGGALASLAAEWATQTRRASQVNLYTFGCPRVGMEGFVRRFEDRIQGGSIFRVYHRTDPIPMVPIWPFMHLQDEGIYSIPSPGQFISPEYHKMANYINSVGNKSWEVLEALYDESVEDSVIERWLSSDSFVSLTANTLRMFGSAISYVIRKVLKAAAITIQTVFGAGTTLLDQLAYILNRGLSVAEAVSGWVISLVRKMARALGIGLREGKNMTLQFIRYVLNSLSNYVRQLVQKSIDFITG